MKPKIEISLTPEQWVEVYYSLDSKKSQIMNGNMGHPIDNKWINELAAIMEEIETKVEV